VSSIYCCLQRSVRVGWCLPKFLLDEDIGVSSMLVPTIFVTVGWCLQRFMWFSPARVSKLNYVYFDLSLHAFIVLKLMNG
jgi:hypothetical protein